MKRSEFEAYRGYRRRVDNRLWCLAFVVAVAAGYFLGEASNLFIGAAVTIVLLVLYEIVHRRFARSLWTRRFPELRDAKVRWHGGLLGRGFVLGRDEPEHASRDIQSPTKRA